MALPWGAGLAAAVLAPLAGMAVLLLAPRGRRLSLLWWNALPPVLAVALYAWAMAQ